MTLDFRPKIKTICGDTKPTDLIFRSPVIIKFRSDFIFAGRGFNITFNAIQYPIPTKFHCLNGKFIAEEKKCDGKIDCEDASDETGCESKLPVSNFTCGLVKMHEPTSSSLRMLGGQIANEGSWPWQVSLQLSELEPSGHFCGAALIHPQFVATAGHCVR